MTRTENNVDISNAERAAIANDANADLYFRIQPTAQPINLFRGISPDTRKKIHN
jgi:N-acetylmuramoyl-L-alanine amidase